MWPERTKASAANATGSAPRARGSSAASMRQSERLLHAPGPHSHSDDGTLPDYKQLINFPYVSRRGSSGMGKREGANCVMCGERSGSSTNCHIPGQNKGVCRACDSCMWRHAATGTPFKWCKGCKRFYALTRFGKKVGGVKCTDCRERGRQSYLAKKGGRGDEPAAAAADGGADKSARSDRLRQQRKRRRQQQQQQQCSGSEEDPDSTSDASSSAYTSDDHEASSIDVPLRRRGGAAAAKRRCRTPPPPAAAHRRGDSDASATFHQVSILLQAAALSSVPSPPPLHALPPMQPAVKIEPPLGGSGGAFARAQYAAGCAAGCAPSVLRRFVAPPPGAIAGFWAGQQHQQQLAAGSGMVPPKRAFLSRFAQQQHERAPLQAAAAAAAAPRLAWADSGVAQHTDCALRLLALSRGVGDAPRHTPQRIVSA